LLSGVVSDTVNLRSPTTTVADKQAVKRLANIVYGRADDDDDDNDDDDDDDDNDDDDGDDSDDSADEGDGGDGGVRHAAAVAALSEGMLQGRWRS
jgi:hypothetical protein